MNILGIRTFNLTRNGKWISHASLLCNEVSVVRNNLVHSAVEWGKRRAEKFRSPSGNVSHHRENLSYALALPDR